MTSPARDTPPPSTKVGTSSSVAVVAMPAPRPAPPAPLPRRRHQGWTARVHLHAPVTATDAAWTPRVDADVPQVHGIAGAAGEERVVDDGSTTYAGGQHEADHGVHVAPGTEPVLAEREAVPVARQPDRRRRGCC